MDLKIWLAIGSLFFGIVFFVIKIYYLELKRKKVAKSIYNLYIKYLISHLNYKTPSELDFLQFNMLSKYMDIYYNDKKIADKFEIFIAHFMKWRTGVYIPNAENFDAYEAMIARVREELSSCSV